MKVLAIGENARNLAQDIFPEAEVDTTPLLPGKRRTDYDSVLSYMALPCVPYREVMKTARAWVDALKPGGELTLMVPSLEWAAVQILSPERSPALTLHLYGEQSNPQRFHSSGFTMLDLRSLCSMVGVAVTHASTGEYTINDNVCEMHTVRGVKK
jgi:predicted SAM-dependent methyltransferase